MVTTLNTKNQHAMVTTAQARKVFLFDLDLVERLHYVHYTKTMSKEEALQRIIDECEDLSLLSVKLRTIARRQRKQLINQ